jgi:hypothetical protein
MSTHCVRSKSELLEALARRAPSILIRGALRDVACFALPPGANLRGEDASASIYFAEGEDGVRLTADNRIADLSLLASPRQRALFCDTEQTSLGHVDLRNLVLEGQLQVIATGKLRQGALSATGIAIRKANTLERADTASGNGVHVLQGALTLWNQQADPGSHLTASLENIRIGAATSPVLGGGVFVSGYAARGGGRVTLERVIVESVYADSGLPRGTTERVAGGLFILHGARAASVLSTGALETFGANCVALDNWGEVGEWTAQAPVRTHGPSAIAIVNAGALGSLSVEGCVETFGEGARGMSVYADTGMIRLASVVTHGDAACGVHLTRPVRGLLVRDGICTHGASGESLVKGQIERMHADGITMIEAGAVQRLEIIGPISVRGAGAAAIRVQPDESPVQECID